MAFFHRSPEPIWHRVASIWTATRRDLNYDEWPVIGRLAFVICCFFGAIQVEHIIGVLAMVLVIPYAIYRFVRVAVQATTADPNVHLEMVDAHRSPAAAMQNKSDDPNASREHDHSAPPTAPSAPLQPVATKHPWRRRGQASWRHAAHQELRMRPLRDRASSIVGSMLAAGVVGPVAALLACLLMTPDLRIELFLWMATVTSLASWAMIVPSQVVEGRIEDHAPLRFFNLLIGAVVGVAAWMIAEMNYLGLPALHDFSPGPNDTLFNEMFGWNVDGIQSAYINGSVTVPLTMYVAYFAFLFVLLRWWRMAEWTRTTRVSLWSTAFAGFIGWGLTFFWWFPQPTGMLLAAAIAFTVQLSSPWLSPSERRELAQRAA